MSDLIDIFVTEQRLLQPNRYVRYLKLPCGCRTRVYYEKRHGAWYALPIDFHEDKGCSRHLWDKIDNVAFRPIRITEKLVEANSDLRAEKTKWWLQSLFDWFKSGTQQPTELKGPALSAREVLESSSSTVRKKEKSEEVSTE